MPADPPGPGEVVVFVPGEARKDAAVVALRAAGELFLVHDSTLPGRVWHITTSPRGGAIAAEAVRKEMGADGDN